jgi:molecular chaperone DnaK (HSP70)
VSSKYIVGIDLGTTNCSLSYASIESGIIEKLPIAQVTKPGIEEESMLLPSFLYFPLEEELEKQLTAPSWDKSRKLSVGSLAKERGQEVPNRLVASAKSWLSVQEISKNSPILPIDAEEQLRISPIDALSELLKHIKEVWDIKHPKDLLEKQTVLITVPASFNMELSSYVEAAAKKAGYPEVILLEEPQAAFYAWLYKEEDNWRKELKADDKVLVIDIGGGTTDFSLINVKDDSGNLALERVMVGEHLLLGGDNIDLALAYFARQKLEDTGKTIDAFQFAQLIHKVRESKEQFLSENAKESLTVTLSTKGRKLIGGSVSLELNKEEVLKFLLEVFLPSVTVNEQVIKEKRGGLKELGLPYVQDARISAQLAAFLCQQKTFCLPKAVLFNGGTLKGALLRQKISEQLNLWAKEIGQEAVSVLKDPDLEFAVSKGAVFYGLARLGKALRIKAGTSRSYFVGIESPVPAVPGFKPSIKALCIAPLGMEEGSSLDIKDKEFTLLLGQNVTFRFFSDQTAVDAGALVNEKEYKLQELAQLEAFLEGDGAARVTLQSKITELGALQIFCVSEEGKKWKLEFNLR